eukprot:16315458-Heterocapsa_arctica.AAC.1
MGLAPFTEQPPLPRGSHDTTTHAGDTGPPRSDCQPGSTTGAPLPTTVQCFAIDTPPEGETMPYCASGVVAQ